MTDVGNPLRERDSPPRKHGYLEAPLATKGFPKGIPYIVGNEAAERFSYYGMRAILMVFMTKYLLNSQGLIDPLDETTAKAAFHLFLSAVYFFPLAGALLSDIWLGKYRTILGLSIVYCIGPLALALDHTRLGLALGLGLIAVGSGGIKPCVSAHVGDQFGASNRHLLEKTFAWFYFAINFGSCVSTLLTPWLLDAFGPTVAFGVPGVLMLLATVIFWLGRNKFVHIPPGGRQFFRDLVSRRSLVPVLKLLPLYLFVAMFWSLYDQSSSAWVLQAEHMDRHVLGYEIKASQVQAINPVLIMLYIPLFAYVVYPAMERVFRLTPLRKVGLGLFVTSLSFVASALIERQIVEGATPHMGWQWLAFAIITAAEMMVSITCLEFSYTQAPPRMKSLVMAVNMFSVSLGNAFTSAFNYLIQGNESLKLSGPDYYWLFAGMMLVTAVAFVFFARGYHEQSHLQSELPGAAG